MELENLKPVRCSTPVRTPKVGVLHAVMSGSEDTGFDNKAFSDQGNLIWNDDKWDACNVASGLSPAAVLPMGKTGKEPAPLMMMNDMFEHVILPMLDPKSQDYLDVRVTPAGGKAAAEGRNSTERNIFTPTIPADAFTKSGHTIEIAADYKSLYVHVDPKRLAAIARSLEDAFRYDVRPVSNHRLAPIGWSCWYPYNGTISRPKALVQLGSRGRQLRLIPKIGITELAEWKSVGKYHSLMAAAIRYFIGGKADYAGSSTLEIQSPKVLSLFDKGCAWSRGKDSSALQPGDFYAMAAYIIEAYGDTFLVDGDATKPDRPTVELTWDSLITTEFMGFLGLPFSQALPRISIPPVTKDADLEMVANQIRGILIFNLILCICASKTKTPIVPIVYELESGRPNQIKPWIQSHLVDKPTINTKGAHDKWMHPAVWGSVPEGIRMPGLVGTSRGGKSQMWDDDEMISSETFVDTRIEGRRITIPIEEGNPYKHIALRMIPSRDAIAQFVKTPDNARTVIQLIIDTDVPEFETEPFDATEVLISYLLSAEQTGASGVWVSSSMFRPRVRQYVGSYATGGRATTQVDGEVRQAIPGSTPVTGVSGAHTIVPPGDSATAQQAHASMTAKLGSGSGDVHDEAKPAEPGTPEPPSATPNDTVTPSDPE